MQNYFDIFNLDTNFVIDKQILKQAFNQQIIKFHPDKFANADANEKNIAFKNTSLINTAFEVLNDDLSRANYLLELNNINAFDEKDTVMNTDFLLEQMELQERLELLSSELEIDSFMDKIDSKIMQNINELNTSFIANDLKSSKNLVRELKFYQQLKTQIDNKLNNFI